MITKAKKRTSNPLKWHGGKTYLAKKIITQFPKHVHYVEPFFGGGAVFFRKPDEHIENHSEVINDIHGELVNFWDVLRNESQFKRLKRKVESTPFSKQVWEKTFDVGSKPVDRAWALFVRYRQSRQGLGKDFATMSRTRTRRGMNEQVSSWLSAISGLTDAHDRLKRVAIFNEKATTVIQREDAKDTFFYCDPPYLHATRSVSSAYEFEMSDIDHRELLQCLASIKGKFLLSGYPSLLYEEFALEQGWSRINIIIDNKASSKKKKPKKTECLWFNY